MQTSCISASDAALQQAADLLKAGEVVAIPTETVYGLAASALSNEAVCKIFAAKGRPQDNPLISHISSMDMLPMLAKNVPEGAYRLAKAFWPGPLTMILPRSDLVADAVCAGLDTAAVRMPSHPVARKLIALCGLPLAAPSANLSGSPSPTTAQDVLADMDGRVPLILDGGACKVGVESTVISLAGETPVLLRPGYITQKQLEQVLGVPVVMSHAIVNPLGAGEKAASPGMKYKHYAPKANVILVQGDTSAYCAYVNEHAAPGVYALCFAGEETGLHCPCVTYGAQNDAAAQAQHIFSALRELDAKGAAKAYAHCPETTGVALAVYNRMLRAAAFQVVKL